MEENLWYLDDTKMEDDNYVFNEYDVTAAPNDFNIKTLFDFLESGVVRIPGFQRNYVWDIKRASKLIESIIIGLPIPQIFLYEETRNRFLVIDGQQRLMSIYYFIKQRFPLKEKRVELRGIFDKYGKIPDEVLYDDRFFSNFSLKLPENLPDKPNKLNKLKYSTLGEYKSTFEIKTIRSIIVKQNLPEGDNSSIYEIFNRLNSGGLNLKPQEIRTSLYHSPFYEMLNRINLHPKWRELTGQPNPDTHSKDVEILLRGFAMLFDGENYKPSMLKFLNSFSKTSQGLTQESIQYMESLFVSFLKCCKRLDDRTFMTKVGKFNISMYEAVFVVISKPFFNQRQTISFELEPAKIQKLKSDPDFIDATQSNTASKENVRMRNYRAEYILLRN